jgi:hypothetical protein
MPKVMVEGSIDEYNDVEDDDICMLVGVMLNTAY